MEQQLLPNFSNLQQACYLANYQNSLKLPKCHDIYYSNPLEPDELDAAIGRISINFVNLEEELKKRIKLMLEIAEPMGSILTAELSFRNSVDIFASLCFHLIGKKLFNTVPGYEKASIKALIQACQKCEELRNKTIHSSYILNYQKDNKIFRSKTSAKAKRGLLEINEEIDVPNLYNMADYICFITNEVEELFLLWSDATPTSP